MGAPVLVAVVEGEAMASAEDARTATRRSRSTSSRARRACRAGRSASTSPRACSPARSSGGRVAYYGPSHKERLELIGSLQDRGLRIEAIRDLVVRIDKGELDLAAWLGLDAQLQVPWPEDRPVTVTEDELYELSGRRRAGLVATLVRGKLAERRGNVFFVPSPTLLRIASRLEGAGVDVEAAVKAGDVLKKHLDRAAKDLVELIEKQAATEQVETDWGHALEEARPLVMDVIRLFFGQAMERELRTLVESGRLAKVAKKRGPPPGGG